MTIGTDRRAGDRRRGESAAIVARLRAGETVVFERVHRGKDGRSIPVEVSSRIFDLDGAPLVPLDLPRHHRAQARRGGAAHANARAGAPERGAEETRPAARGLRARRLARAQDAGGQACDAAGDPARHRRARGVRAGDRQGRGGHGVLDTAAAAGDPQPARARAARVGRPRVSPRSGAARPGRQRRGRRLSARAERPGHRRWKSTSRRSRSPATPRCSGTCFPICSTMR